MSEAAYIAIALFIGGILVGAGRFILLKLDSLSTNNAAQIIRIDAERLQLQTHSDALIEAVRTHCNTELALIRSEIALHVQLNKTDKEYADKSFDHLEKKVYFDGDKIAALLGRTEEYRRDIENLKENHK